MQRLYSAVGSVGYLALLLATHTLLINDKIHYYLTLSRNQIYARCWRVEDMSG